MHAFKHTRLSSSIVLALALTSAAPLALAHVHGEGLDNISAASAANPEAMQQAIAKLQNIIKTKFPTLPDQAQENAQAVYKLFQMFVQNPNAIAGGNPADPDLKCHCIDSFPNPQAFADFLAAARDNPAEAMAMIQAHGSDAADHAAFIGDTISQMSDKLPANMANNLETVADMMGGIFGGTLGGNGGSAFNGVANGVPVAGSIISMVLGGAGGGMLGGLPVIGGLSGGAGGLPVVGGLLGGSGLLGGLTGGLGGGSSSGGLLGATPLIGGLPVIGGLLGSPSTPVDGGAGGAPSLLPTMDLGSSHSGGPGFSQTLDFKPLVNSNMLTGGIREAFVKALPTLPAMLPNSMLGILNFKTYAATDRTGREKKTTNVNSADWTGGEIEIAVPGVGHVFSIEMICPGLNRHRVAANSPDGSNPDFDPNAEANYTGYTDLDLTNRKMNFSWGFGDGLVDDIWVYFFHYILWTPFGQGDSGPGFHHPGDATAQDATGGSDAGEHDGHTATQSAPAAGGVGLGLLGL